jgi:uncharacterized protein (TIGR03083 family)
MTENTQELRAGYADLLAILHRSHDRLVAALSPLGVDELSQQSYDDDWSIAQVASHLGSGAEINGLCVTAALTGTPPPDMEHFQHIWDTWNAKSPKQQADDALSADTRLLTQLDALTADDHARWHLELFGSEQSPADLVRLRLSELAVHTWDIAVALDPTETVDEQAAAVIIDNLPWMVERIAKGVAEPATISVRTTAPDRRLVLTLTTEGGELTPDDADDHGTTARISLPGEAFVRLTYGRLDPDHTPTSVTTEGIDLDTLRGSFPGL